MISPETKLEFIKGIGPKFAEKLNKLGIKTAKDLLWHFPFRYEDFSKISKIAEIEIGQQVTVQGIIKKIDIRRTARRKMYLVEAIVADETGEVRAVWFNQKFLMTMLKPGMALNLSGKVAPGTGKRLTLQHPMHEVIPHYMKDVEMADEEVVLDADNNEFKHTGRLVPIYPETRGITSKGLRYLIKPLLESIKKSSDPLPPNIRKKFKIMEVNEALNKVHFPEELEEAQQAKERFAFEDLFYLQLLNIKERMRIEKLPAHKFLKDIEYVKDIIKDLPFEMTESQKKALWEVIQDLEQPHPMNRLLQGDVGSGKTIVALIAAILVASPSDKNFKQVAFMAPTEVLANQHYETFKKIFEKFDKGVGLMTGSSAKIFYGDGLETNLKKNELIKKISSGEVKIVIGTQALIQKSVIWDDLSLVIVDEQHRFGVRQRAALAAHRDGGDEKKNTPHFLSMSATPIPRTLSLAIFGDLKISLITELPKGRKEIITKVVSPSNRDKAYAFIRGEVHKGRQAFVICPRIEKSEEDLLDKNQLIQFEVKTVKEEYEKLSKKVFPDLKIGSLHGKMKAQEKEKIMTDFKNKKIDILVTTSVIEVGVDVPNASIMVIEGSERFGLAQLYQFRGRVGRGIHQSFCLLFTEINSQTVKERLKHLIEAKSGFELAEYDLKFRGPGQFLGQEQTGLPDLAMRSLQNPKIIKEAREAAEMIIEKDLELKKYPALVKKLSEFNQIVHHE